MNIIKKLPKIYQNNIDRIINNNREVYYSFSKNIDNGISVNQTNNIDITLEKIFNSNTAVYNIPVIINTVNKEYDTYLVARTSSYLLTIDQDRIKLKDIISIKIKNPI